jgi:hypothetical protein
MNRRKTLTRIRFTSGFAGEGFLVTGEREFEVYDAAGQKLALSEGFLWSMETIAKLGEFETDEERARLIDARSGHRSSRPNLLETPMMLPKTIEAWLALPEVPLPRRYLVTNVGVLEARLEDCRRSGVPGLPRAQPDEAGLAVRLPNITVDAGDAGPVFYRLPLDFGPIAKAIFEAAGRAYAQGQQLLPCHYTFGMREDGAFAAPDGATTRVSLERN